MGRPSDVRWFVGLQVGLLLVVGCGDPPASFDAADADSSPPQPDAPLLDSGPVSGVCPPVTYWSGWIRTFGGRCWANDIAVDIAVDGDTIDVACAPLCSVEECFDSDTLLQTYLPHLEGASVLRNGTEELKRIAVSGEYLYVTANPESYPWSNVLWRVAKSGGEPEILADQVGDVVFSDESSVYYMAGAGYDAPGTFSRADLDGANVQPLASPEYWVAVEQVGNSFYWLTEWPRPALWRTAKAGGEPELVAELGGDPGSVRPSYFAASPSGLFVAHPDIDGGKIDKIPFEGGESETVVSLPARDYVFEDLGADEGDLYWTTRLPAGDGYVHTVPVTGGCIRSREVSYPRFVAPAPGGVVFIDAAGVNYLAR